MATNQILQFANSVSANVLTPSAYAAETALIANGFVSGIADSQTLNTVWRQSSFVTTMIADFIVNHANTNVNDDGNLPVLLSGFETALARTFSPTIGSISGAKMSIATASASGTFTADELILENVLGGQTYKLSSYSQVINLGTTGAGGMDTGTAPVSGYVALYAIYNPTTFTASILATDCTSSVAPTIYGGSHLPSGYSGSALIGVLPTNGSSQFIAGILQGKEFFFIPISVLSSSTTHSSFTSLSVAGAVPKNAKTTSGYCLLTNDTAGDGVVLQLAADVSGIGNKIFSITAPIANSGIYLPFNTLPIITAQTIYYVFTNALGGTPSVNLVINSYTF